MTATTAPTLSSTAPRPLAGRKRPSLSRAGWPTYVVAWALVGLCIAPVLYIIIGGFRTNAEITVDPSGFPTKWQFVNYSEVLSSPIFWRQVANSVICAVGTTVGVVILGVAASFVLARYNFSGRAALYALPEGMATLDDTDPAGWRIAVARGGAVPDVGHQAGVGATSGERTARNGRPAAAPVRNTNPKAQ